ncbi:5'-3' exoribonuclease 1, partial [Fragariocoptes setiger]
MGIPKFFRWMSERYPNLCQTAKDHQLPEVDNLYLDMNGIIHNCSHPCDGDVHFRISEQEMFDDIFNYVSTLFTIIKPRKYFFMAVDGVAPRAKMNQQRGRRFRSAKEASDREDAAVAKGAILPTEERFDSNCITPGTNFMVKLNAALQQFVETKLSTDPQWQHVKIILSGHETPGEGEHKIMDFIRYQRSQPSYDPNTRHCLYGLDTDLIMLALSSHEPHFTLLREEIKFNNRKDASKGKSQRIDPSRINFHVLYLSLLRDYIEQDFEPLKSILPYKFDLESIIDDWILICFLVGNDFIPHIPHFHIHKSALPRIFEAYRDVLPKLDGYLNEKGFLNLKRFRKFASELADLDIENFTMLSDPKQANHSFGKARVAGAPRSNNNKYRSSAKNDSSAQPKNQYTNHSLNHQSGVWLNINRFGRNSSSNNNNNINNNNGGKNNNSNNNHSGHLNHQQTRNMHLDSPQARHHNHTNNTNGFSGSPPGKTAVNGQNSNGKSSTPFKPGVHNFSEKQLNSSIKLCADGDFMDLSDGEYSSDEKFPSDNNHHHRHHSQQQQQQQQSPQQQLQQNQSQLQQTPRRKQKQQREISFRNTTIYSSNAKNNATNINNGNNNNRDKVDRSKMNGIVKEFKTLHIERGPTTKKTVYSKQVIAEFNEHKRDYYRTKFKIEPTAENIQTVVHEYIRALQWNLHYYYHGCVSWGWYYPYHYAPFISDVNDLAGVNLKFDMGEPFKPFDQLLAVLPPASSSLLPKIYRSLVMSPDSPLAQYFPSEVEYDLNGKQNDWEAVVLTPFIDEGALINSTKVYNFFLSPEERGKNVHGPHLMYECQFHNESNSKASIDGSNMTNGGFIKKHGKMRDETRSNGQQQQQQHGSEKRFVAKVVRTEIPVRGFNLPVEKIKFGLLLQKSITTNNNNNSNSCGKSNNSSYNNNSYNSISYNNNKSEPVRVYRKA